MDASWAERAACREPGTDPDLFFPVSESGPAVRQITAAKAVCARCAVAAECRGWALRAGEPVGIWGGTTPEERRALRHAGNELAGAQRCWPGTFGGQARCGGGRPAAAVPR